MTKTLGNPYKELAEFKNGMFHFSFGASLDWMEKQGKTLFGDHFRIFTEDHPLIFKLLVYAIGDAESSARQGLDPGKGLLVTGPIGCGNVEYLIM